MGHLGGWVGDVRDLVVGKQERVLTLSRCSVRCLEGSPAQRTSSRTKLALGVKGCSGEGKGKRCLIQFQGLRERQRQRQRKVVEAKDEGFKSSSPFLSLSLERSRLILSSRES